MHAQSHQAHTSSLCWLVVHLCLEVIGAWRTCMFWSEWCRLWHLQKAILDSRALDWYTPLSEVKTSKCSLVSLDNRWWYQSLCSYHATQIYIWPLVDLSSIAFPCLWVGWLAMKLWMKLPGLRFNQVFWLLRLRWHRLWSLQKCSTVNRYSWYTPLSEVKQANLAWSV